MVANLLIHPLHDFRLLSYGNLGWVYKINERIVVKIPRKKGNESFTREIQAFDIFEQHPPCPNIAQSFLRIPQGIFLPCFKGGTLEQRLRASQTRDKENCGNRVIGIAKKEPIALVERWIMELSNAAAWLESLGYVHGDMAPQNLVLDEFEHLKLIDFESLAEIGTDSEGSHPPWARLQGSEAGEEEGTFGPYGPRTEQFAIGSILYLMTRGFEPYEDDDFGPEHGPIVVDRLRQMEFPELSEGHLDRIIQNCWTGKFGLLQDLARETQLLDGAQQLPQAMPFGPEYCIACRKECQAIVDSGALKPK